MNTSTDRDNDTPIARCATEAEVRATVGRVCTVTGTYELRDFTNKKGAVFRTWPVVILADGAAIALESLWDESKMPADDDINRWRGRSVEVTGMLHSQPPAQDRKANMAQLTISPVDSLRLVP